MTRTYDVGTALMSVSYIQTNVLFLARAKVF
jgi:hypothetical protein